MQDPFNQSNDSNVFNLMTAQKSVLTYLTSNLNIPKNQSVRNKHDRDNTLRQVGGIANLTCVSNCVCFQQAVSLGILTGINKLFDRSF